MISKNIHITRYARQIVLLASGLFFALVLMGPSCEGKYPVFSHRNHVKKQNLQCNDCHTGSADGIQAGAPDPATCTACHEETEKYTAIADQLIKKWPRFRALPPDGKFSHKTHEDSGVKCEDCHRNVAKSNGITFSNMPTESTCLDCHKKRSGAAECSVCHQTINRDTPPQNHSQSWERFHGDSARDPVMGERCVRCHQRNYCDSCHNVQKPLDHTIAWKDFGHGTTAQIDRSRCATCHKSDFCVRCHSETPPMSHRGGWGPPLDRHCNECHLTGGVQNCTVCHGTRIMHRSAPTRPNTPPHQLATDCRSCHHGFLLKHADNGDNCKTCHK